MSSFLRNVFIMLRGSVLAQIATVLGGLYLAKLFGPESYGVYGSVISISSIVALGLSLQLDKAIVLSKNFKSKKTWVSFLIPFILIATALLILLLKIINTGFIQTSKELLIFSLLIASCLSISWVYEGLLTSNKRFTILSNAKIALSIFIVLFQFFCFKANIENGLIIGFLFAQLAILIYFVLKNKNYLGAIDISHLKWILNQHKDIFYYLFPSNVINGIGLHIMPILILAYFSAEVAAVYFLSLKILSAPLHLMTSSIGNVFFKRASDSSSKTNLYSTTKKVVLVNVAIMIVFLIFINTIGIELLNYFFSPKWEQLSVFLLILSFLFLARASFNPISSLIVVQRKNHIGLLFNIYLVFVNILAIAVGCVYNDIIYTLYILSVFGGIGYFSLLYYFGKQLKNAQ